MRFKVVYHLVLEKAMRLTRTEAAASATALFALVVALLLVFVGTAEPTTVLHMSRRVIAKPVEVKAAEPVRRHVPASAAASACPQLDNPGGLRWQPSANAGPWATDGIVRLPKFGVSAPIVKVGVDSDSHMVVPRNAHEVGWLDQGPFPGDTQNAVLAGHIRWSGVPGSFGRLTQMAPGDIVAVELGGKHWEFRVTWMCLFDRNTSLASKIMGRTNVPSVTLISCGGVWDSAAGTHNKRVAVRAELVGSA